MPNHKNSDKKAIGRPRNVDPHIVLGNAKVFRAQFSHAWPTLGKQILAAKSPVEVWDVVKSGRGIISNMHDFRFSERIFERQFCAILGAAPEPPAITEKA